jgi:hypothetical protein
MKFYALIPFFFFLLLDLYSPFLLGVYLDLYLLALSWRLEGKGMERMKRLFTNALFYGSWGGHEDDS